MKMSYPMENPTVSDYNQPANLNLENVPSAHFALPSQTVEIEKLQKQYTDQFEEQSNQLTQIQERLSSVYPVSKEMTSNDRQKPTEMHQVPSLAGMPPFQQTNIQKGQKFTSTSVNESQFTNKNNFGMIPPAMPNMV